MGSLVVGIVAGFSLLFLIFPMRHSPHVVRKAVCLSHVKDIALAIQMYLADNDDVFPDAARWCDRLLSYTNEPEVYRCPSTEGQRCSYVYNAALSTAMYDTLADPGNTVVLFEGDAAWNGSGGLMLLPEEPRHLGGDNYGFADGHAKWVRRNWEKRPVEDVIWHGD